MSVLVQPSVPPMGWNGYNHFGPGMTGAQIMAGAQQLVSTGMAAAGYEYVIIDGGWATLDRDPGGNLVPSPVLYPQGIGAVVTCIHSLGLKAGIYLSAGTANCARTMAGSWEHYEQDANWVAAQGFDFVKFDYCEPPPVQTPLTPRDVRADATRMAAALTAAGRPILLDINCAKSPHGEVWEWGRMAGAGMGRVIGDIQDTFKNMVNHLAAGIAYAGFAGNGYWNDLDALETGNGGMTAAQDRSEFSLWVILGAPLIAGNDLTAMDAHTLQTFTTPAVLAVNQSPQPGHLVKQSGTSYVLARPMVNGNMAVALFNAGSETVTISTTASALHLPPAASYTLVNLWSGAVTTTAGAVSADVGAGAVRMYEVSAG